jgi:cell division transport system permease protein
MRASFVMSGVGQGLRRNLLMSVSLIMITFVSLYFLGGSLLSNKEIDKFRKQYEDKLNVSVYLCGPAPYVRGSNCTHVVTAAERDALGAKLRADPHITSAQYRSQEEIYKINKGFLGSGPASEILSAADFPNEYVIKLKDLKRDYASVNKRYGREPGVEVMQSEDAGLKTILDILDSSRVGALAFALLVLVAAMLLMVITIQVAAAQRRNETNIMRLVGASRWMTQLPFIIEAVIAALIGGLLTIPALWFSKRYVLNGIFSEPVSRKVLPDLSVNDVLIAGGSAIAVGIVLAIITAYTTLRAYVRI